MTVESDTHSDAISISRLIYLIQVVISVILQLAIAWLIVALMGKQLWLSAFAGSIILALTFLPALLERQLSVQLPVEFTLITTAFLYAAFALGEHQDFYGRFWWWDLMLHSLSALTIGIFGFLMVYVFHLTGRINIAPIYLAIVTLCLSVTTGTLWEIFEFSMDWFFDFNMQKSGLVDTMTDLIVNAVGGLLAALLGYLYVKNGDSLIVDRAVRRFVEKNPRFFERHKLKGRHKLSARN